MPPWFTARELTGLPGFEMTERHVRERLRDGGVPSRSRRKRGGGVEWDSSALPPETRAALGLPALLNPVAPLPIAPPLPVKPEPLPATVPAGPKRLLDDEAKRVADARLALARWMEPHVPKVGMRSAAHKLILQLKDGTADKALVEVARIANQRAKDIRLSERSLRGWFYAYRDHGWFGMLPYAPKPSTSELAPDVAAVLDRYHSTDPQFANLTSCAKHVTRELGRNFDSWRALFDRARRALKKVDKVKLIKARHGGSDRAAKLPFKRRSTKDMSPLDLWLIDGHTFKAKVRHPDHGAPFAPEVTMVMDAKTRMVTGWSVSLSENVIAVGDALLNAIRNHGQPAAVYSDNGAGQTGKQIDCPVMGIMARLGIEHETGRPGNPQGRGAIERSWQQTMIECARQFGSYQGSDVDGQRLRKVTAELAKEQRALRRAAESGSAEVLKLSPKAPSWQQFMDAVDAAVASYNTTHRHRELPKRDDGLHMTPAEAWDAMLDPALQFKEDPLALRMMFMPCVQRVARRGEVKFLNQIYFSPELMQFDGQTVRVHYDIRDSNRVLIQNFKGEIICEAKWGANTVDYFPKAVIEMAREKRVQGIVKRRQAQIDTALRELSGTHTLDAGRSLPAPQSPNTLQPLLSASPAPLACDTVLDVEARPVAAAAARPVFETQSQRYEWLLAHRDEWNETDPGWLAAYVASEDYEDLREFFESRGLGWTEGGDASGFEEGVR